MCRVIRKKMLRRGCGEGGGGKRKSMDKRNREIKRMGIRRERIIMMMEKEGKEDERESE